MKPTQQLHDLGQSLWLDNITLVIFRAGLFCRHLLGCHCENPEAIIAQPVVLFFQTDNQARVHRRNLAIQLEVRALVENFFRSAFREKDRFAFWGLHEDRHHAPREVEREFVQLLVLG